MKRSEFLKTLGLATAAVVASNSIVISAFERFTPTTDPVMDLNALKRLALEEFMEEMERVFFFGSNEKILFCGDDFYKKFVKERNRYAL